MLFALHAYAIGERGPFFYNQRMQAELRSLFSTDVDDLASYAPGETFCLTLRALVGPVDLPGEESFDFELCSPAWLAAEVEREHLVSGRFHLFMVRFDFAAVERYIARRIAQATGTDWPEIATKLARWSRWEFEDYVELPPTR